MSNSVRMNSKISFHLSLMSSIIPVLLMVMKSKTIRNGSLSQMFLTRYILAEKGGKDKEKSIKEQSDALLN